MPHPSAFVIVCRSLGRPAAGNAAPEDDGVGSRGENLRPAASQCASARNPAIATAVSLSFGQVNFAALVYGATLR
jgi:hypothetical protein